MSDFKSRLVEEQSELNRKIESLEAFTATSNFKQIDATQQLLLSIQLPAMITYNQCLVERINLLN